MKIGAIDEAESIRHALIFFNVPDPENHLEVRKQFIASLDLEIPHEFLTLSDAILGSESVWEKLDQYAAKFMNQFDPNFLAKVL